jgi:hypothetical protein
MESQTVGVQKFFNGAEEFFVVCIIIAGMIRLVFYGIGKKRVEQSSFTVVEGVLFPLLSQIGMLVVFLVKVPLVSGLVPCD